MTPKRRSLPVDVRRLVLHESGYKCGNPSCHSILTLDIHHLERVADEGSDDPYNLLPLCPNCHALHHKGEIPTQSVRAWKMLLLTINEAYDRKTVDVLAALGEVGPVVVSGDGLLTFAGLVAGDLVKVMTLGVTGYDPQWGYQVPSYRLTLTPRGEEFLAAWIAGDQAAAVKSTSDT